MSQWPVLERWFCQQFSEFRAKVIKTREFSKTLRLSLPERASEVFKTVTFPCFKTLSPLARHGCFNGFAVLTVLSKLTVLSTRMHALTRGNSTPLTHAERHRDTDQFRVQRHCVLLREVSLFRIFPCFLTFYGKSLF